MMLITSDLFFSFAQSDHPIGEVVENGLLEVMRKEVQHAVEEIRTELEQVCSSAMLTGYMFFVCLFLSFFLLTPSELTFSYLVKLVMIPSSFFDLQKKILRPASFFFSFCFLEVYRNT